MHKGLSMLTLGTDTADAPVSILQLAKCWNDAADCYVKLAECHLKCDSKHEAASAYVDAAKVGFVSDAKINIGGVLLRSPVAHA